MTRPQDPTWFVSVTGRRLAAVFATILLASSVSPIAMARVSTPIGPVAPASTVLPAADCNHAWRSVPTRKYIPAKKKRVQVGKDKKGRPIYKWIQVRPARWETVYETRCSKCNRKKG